MSPLKTDIGQSLETTTPTLDACAASYARFSCDSQHEESISDQQRQCRDKAAQNGHAILPATEYSDHAISGTKLAREGLDAMLADARAGRFRVLYLYSLSRLARESVITLQLLKDLVYNHNVRVVCTSESIDTDQATWEVVAQVMAIVHDQYVKDLARGVFRGMEGSVLRGCSVGDHCFGYTSKPIAGSETGSRGNGATPRMEYTIDDERAEWVKQIFRWYVDERRSVFWIAKELTRLGAPKDRRATKPGWRHQYVLGLLRNPKYVGLWPWGTTKTRRDPLTGKTWRVERPPEERNEAWIRDFPHLKIIEREVFAAAQRILDENSARHAANRKSKGRFNGSQGGDAAAHPRRLLSGLIVCGQCGRTFHAGGTGGKYLFCPDYIIGTCTCQTQLPRERAEKMILDAIGQRILGNHAWRKQVQDEVAKAWRSQEARIPTELESARKSLKETECKIGHLVDQLENGISGPELAERLAQRRAEKRELTERVARLECVDHGRPPEPTAEWIDQQLTNLHGLLNDGTPAAAHVLRALVGGQIVVTEVRKEGNKRHYLRGRFTLDARRIVHQLVGTSKGDAAVNEPPATEKCTEVVVIDFRRPLKIEVDSERAKALYDQGMMNVEIGREMELSNGRVYMLLRHWFSSRGLQMPNGKARRSALNRQFVQPPQYQDIADRVMALYKKDLLVKEIVDQLGVAHKTVTKAIQWWHTTRGLPVPDGRTRRKSLDRKTSG